MLVTRYVCGNSVYYFYAYNYFATIYAILTSINERQGVKRERGRRREKESGRTRGEKEGREREGKSRGREGGRKRGREEGREGGRGE